MKKLIIITIITFITAIGFFCRGIYNVENEVQNVVSTEELVEVQALVKDLIVLAAKKTLIMKEEGLSDSEIASNFEEYEFGDSHLINKIIATTVIQTFLMKEEGMSNSAIVRHFKEVNDEWVVIKQ